MGETPLHLTDAAMKQMNLIMHIPLCMVIRFAPAIYLYKTVAIPTIPQKQVLGIAAELKKPNQEKQKTKPTRAHQAGGTVVLSSETQNQ